MRRSGSGFVRCADGKVRWGHFGAAGALFRCRDDDGEWRYLLQLRGQMTHEGGTWAIPGGALDEGESAVEGALREAGEELGDIPPARVDGEFVDHVAADWTYTTVICTVDECFAASTGHWETADVRWVTADEALTLDLHSGAAAAWPRLMAHIAALDDAVRSEGER